jgi:hypothetical protein
MNRASAEVLILSTGRLAKWFSRHSARLATLGVELGSAAVCTPGDAAKRPLDRRLSV